MKYKMLNKEMIFFSLGFENGFIYDSYTHEGNIYLLDGTEKKGTIGLLICENELKYIEKVEGEDEK